MTTPIEKQDGYITLKEASEQFGYSADYIGQLIRKGKIEGKQVYANVVWMTTPEAMEAYLLKVPKQDDTLPADPHKEVILDRVIEGVFPSRVLTAYRSVLYLLLIVLGLFAIFLCYMLADSLGVSLRKQTQTEVVHTYRPNQTAKSVGARTYHHEVR